MARQPRTPGAADAPKATETEVVTPTTAANADANLDAILGTAETPENTGADEATSTASEPVTPEPTAEDLQAKKEYEEFLAWRNSKGKKASAAPVAQHVPTSDATTPKRTRQVVGLHGWTTEEY